jgi:glutamate synthase (NADPH) small chain
MPSFCPKCRAVLEEDEICCAQVRYTWKCTRCSKLSTGFALPYGKCFMCGGEVQLEERRLEDPMKLQAVREAVQFELNSYHFYKMALERVANPRNRAILEHLYHNELDHLHELELKYHAHLDREVLELEPQAEKLLADEIFLGLEFADETAVKQVYELAIAMERRTRDHFRNLASSPGLEAVERDIYGELAAEEEEHVAMLESELAQL